MKKIFSTQNSHFGRRVPIFQCNQQDPTPFFQLPTYCIICTCIFLHHIIIRQYWRTLFSKIIKDTIPHINCNNIQLHCSTTEPSTSPKKRSYKTYLIILLCYWLHSNQPRSDQDTQIRSLELRQKRCPAPCIVVWFQFRSVSVPFFVLVLFWFHSGVVLVPFWFCSSSVLVLFQFCFGSVLVLFWYTHE